MNKKDYSDWELDILDSKIRNYVRFQPDIGSEAFFRELATDYNVSLSTLYRRMKHIKEQT